MDQLVRLCKKNDSKAQKLIYNKFADTMFRVCFRYLKNEFDVEDVLINGFLKVFNNIKKFEYRDERSFKAWIKRIMINESLLYLRAKSKIKFTDDYNMNNIEEARVEDSNIDAEKIYQLLKELPDGYRTVFNLYVIEGYSHKEISSMLKINENTSKSQLSKARASLRKLMVKYELEYER